MSLGLSLYDMIKFMGALFEVSELNIANRSQILGEKSVFIKSNLQHCFDKFPQLTRILRAARIGERY